MPKRTANDRQRGVARTGTNRQFPSRLRVTPGAPCRFACPPPGITHPAESKQRRGLPANVLPFCACLGDLLLIISLLRSGRGCGRRRCGTGDAPRRRGRPTRACTRARHRLGRSPRSGRAAHARSRRPSDGADPPIALDAHLRANPDALNQRMAATFSPIQRICSEAPTAGPSVRRQEPSDQPHRKRNPTGAIRRPFEPPLDMGGPTVAPLHSGSGTRTSLCAHSSSAPSMRFRARSR